MAYEERDNAGSLFKREKKGDNWPDYSGPCMVGGQLLEVAAWIKTAKSGAKFMSLKFGPRRDKSDTPQNARAEDSDIPF